MQSLIIGQSADGANVTLTGSTQEVWRSRRIAIYFRDYLHASRLPDGREIVVPAGGALLGPLLRTIEDSLTKGGFQFARTVQLANSVNDFQRAEEEFVEFSIKAKEIWANNVQPKNFVVLPMFLPKSYRADGSTTCSCWRHITSHLPTMQQTFRRQVREKRPPSMGHMRI